jgi:hypothetical protein
MTTSKLMSNEPEEKLIRLATAGEILGVSPDAIRKRISPVGVEELTFVDISRPGAQRHTIRLVYSEVVALRDSLIQAARNRVSIDRMLQRRFLKNPAE